ncbi:MAG: PTS transporter subunit EIIC [Bacilli bacterium]
MPLQSAGTGLGAMILVMLLMQLLWFFGLHGFSIVWGIVGILWVPFFLGQLDAYTQGDLQAFATPSPNVVTLIYGMIGGSGCTLGLIIASLIQKKKSASKAIAKLSIIPGLFNINEPVIFGMPIVLNPTLFIPFILIPIVNIIIAYFAHLAGLIAPIIIGGSGAEPIFVNVFVLSGGKLSPVVLYGLLLVIDVILWYPFAKIMADSSLDEA